MSLVRNIDVDPVKQRVTLSMVSLARQMGIEVVGEGVETRSERDTLVRLGCTLLQGFYFARPDKPYPDAAWDNA
jgi:EAL domain-containing protein (putative c-di-GMP-specific phosphodiesterase class I)